MSRAPRVDAVVKIGGGALADAGTFQPALDAIVQLSHRLRLAIVPGGGPFADAVRDADRRLRLPADTSHWMAVLAMDQYALLLTARLNGAVRAETADDIARVLDEGRLPVLAPSRWLRAADPLPHSWDVTSDSIAAWVGAELGARLLVLIKPSGAEGLPVDPYFAHARHPRQTVVVVPAGLAAHMLSEVR